MPYSTKRGTTATGRCWTPPCHNKTKRNYTTPRRRLTQLRPAMPQPCLTERYATQLYPRTTLLCGTGPYCYRARQSPTELNRNGRSPHRTMPSPHPATHHFALAIPRRSLRHHTSTRLHHAMPLLRISEQVTITTLQHFSVLCRCCTSRYRARTIRYTTTL